MKSVDVELHDAIVESASINYMRKSVSLIVAYYPDPVTSSKRIRAKITFSGVERMSGITDFLELASNRAAGNISYWQPATGAGTTYIYLSGGLLSVTAKSLRFSVEA